MTPAEIGECFAGRYGDEVTADEAFGEVTVDVPVAQWVDAASFARDDERLAATYFDWLTAVDELDEGFSVVTHLWSTAHLHHVLLRTRVPREHPRLPTLTGVYAGANWHERETHEMFGVVFDGHPGLAQLLLPDGFEGHPLRKEFVLAARVAKEWPGAREPGESHREGAPKRSRMRPPGVPEPGTWGPAADADAGADGDES